VDRPEEYRWNSLGYHIQNDNKDNFLSLDFGLKEFGVLNAEERLTLYRRYVYEAGAVDCSEIVSRKIIEEAVVEKERKKEFKISRVDRFRYRTRYFTDSGIIGTKEFVSINYKRFKDVFMSKKEKVPKSVAGLDGIYSMKRLAEC
jgi:putative transposase